MTTKPTAKNPNPLLVLVRWDDAWSSTDRVDCDDQETFEKPWIIHTTGFLKTRNKKHVVVCRDFTPGENYKDGKATYQDCQRIPTSVVKEVRILGRLRED